MNEMIDAHAYEMQCNYGSQTPEVLHVSPQRGVAYREASEPWDKFLCHSLPEDFFCVID
jgi:hypothetical protein